MSAPREVPERGTLHLYCHVVPSEPTCPWPRVQTLAMQGQPSGCLLNAGEIEDTEFGDSECKQVPDIPKKAGLWVLVWPWRQIKDEDFGYRVFDCKYGRGAWRRLTADELTWLANGSEVSA